MSSLGSDEAPTNSGAAGSWSDNDDESPGAGGAGGSTPPPEQELESSYLSPVATGHYVWVANPQSGRVAFINAETLQIRVVEAGNEPTYIAAVPSDEKTDTALVLNVRSKDATLLRAGASLTSKTFAVPSGGNRWSVSSDGRWALAWTDSKLVDAADPVDGFQDLTLLDLREGSERSTALSVGYRPVSVSFDEKNESAFVVTQDGITVISLTAAAPAVVKNIKLASAGQSVNTTDVSITPDGSLALVRREGAENILLVSLKSSDRVELPLPGAATDLDLSSDGKAAVAVVRSTGTVALIPIPGAFDDPELIKLVEVGSSDNTIGSASLAEQSSTAFFYSNAIINTQLTVMDIATPTPAPRVLLLRAPIVSVFPTFDGSHALVLHDTAPQGTSGSVYKSAISLVPVAVDLPAKIIGLEAPVKTVAVSPVGDHALVATSAPSGSSHTAYLTSFPSLEVKSFSLASPPIAAGIVPQARRGFIAQEHPDGRITFVHFDTGEVRTLTGFELASQVVYGDAK